MPDDIDWQPWIFFFGQLNNKVGVIDDFILIRVEIAVPGRFSMASVVKTIHLKITGSKFAGNVVVPALMLAEPVHEDHDRFAYLWGIYGHYQLHAVKGRNG